MTTAYTQQAALRTAELVQALKALSINGITDIVSDVDEVMVTVAANCLPEVAPAVSLTDMFYAYSQKSLQQCNLLLKQKLRYFCRC